ncbi:hypothetical protein [Limnohabitans sp. DM1]|uniref:hypothetical protein n=1 Tax=Limnohabitans sp. DM1 TaxID=1597955 RepID=UPI001E48CB18|nr:hypothetical protein [Limnohabitans sp. DM1]
MGDFTRTNTSRHRPRGWDPQKRISTYIVTVKFRQLGRPPQNPNQGGAPRPRTNPDKGDAIAGLKVAVEARASLCLQSETVYFLARLVSPMGAPSTPKLALKKAINWL